MDESKNGAVFMGLTWVEMDGNHFLLAANFSQNRIEVFDKNYKRVRISEEAFSDERIPRDFAPYNVQAVGATVVVTYAMQNSTKTWRRTIAASSAGLWTSSRRRARLVQRLEDGPWLQAPWGVALAPQDFGFFSHDLLIGNRFGGTIAAFDTVTGKFLGDLVDAAGAPIAISGLWGLEFDNRGSNEAGSTASPSAGPALFFAAGINGLCGWIVRDVDTSDGGIDRRRSRSSTPPPTDASARESRGAPLFIADYFRRIQRARFATESSGDSCMLRMYQ